MAKVDCWTAIADARGIFDAQAAQSIGLTSRDLHAFAKNGDIVLLDRGWFSLPFVAPNPEHDTPWDRRRHLHASRTYAAVRARQGAAVASHHSTLILQELPTFAADLRQIHLTRTADDWSRRRPGLTVHQQVPGARFQDGSIDLGTAIVQTGVENGPMAALIAADAALHAGRLTADDLAAAGERVKGPRTAATRRLLCPTDPASESPGETRLRRALMLMGFTVTSQVRIVDGDFLAIVDFLLDDAPVAIEFDGFVKYGRPTPFGLATAPADIVVAEKVREDHIRELGYGMVRVIWRDFENGAELRRRVEAVVQRVTRLAG